MFEFWNEMLVSNIRCKNLSKKAWVSERFLEFWEERGEKLMTCHLFLDNFWNFTTFGLFFKGLGVFETEFSFKKTQISQFWYHEMFVFSEFCFFCKRHVIAGNWLCFRACNSRIVTYDQEFFLWCDFCVLITVTESFEKFP